MSNVLKYLTVNGYGIEYKISVNTPDYLNPVNGYSFLIDPDVTALLTAQVPVKYWKYNGVAVVEMSVAEKNALDDEELNNKTPIIYPVYHIKPGFVSQADTADWPVNRATTVLNDPLNTALKTVQLDNALESGFGFTLKVPASIKKFVISVWYRPLTLPGGVDRSLKFRFYTRDMVDNAPVSAWRFDGLSELIVPQSLNYQYESWNKKLTALGCTADTFIQCQLTRRGQGDTLEYPILINEVSVQFS